MSHCPYLLHKFVINYLLFCVPHLFELPTALIKYLDLLQVPPTPLGRYTYMIMIIKIIEIYNITTQPYWIHAYCMETIAPHISLTYLLSEKKTLRYQTHYAAIQISNCLKRTFVNKVATTDDFCNKWKPSCAYHKIDTFHGEQRWMGHKGGP